MKNIYKFIFLSLLCLGVISLIHTNVSANKISNKNKYHLVSKMPKSMLGNWYVYDKSLHNFVRTKITSNKVYNYYLKNRCAVEVLHKSLNNHKKNKNTNNWLKVNTINRNSVHTVLWNYDSMGVRGVYFDIIKKNGRKVLIVSGGSAVPELNYHSKKDAYRFRNDKLLLHSN